MKQTPIMDAAEAQYKQELADSKRKLCDPPNVGVIARKYGLSVAAFYRARWYLELKALEKKE